MSVRSKYRNDMWSSRRRQIRRKLARRDGAFCYYCKRQQALDSLTLDHVIPVSKGGGHDMENLRLACFVCNLKKGASLL